MGYDYAKYRSQIDKEKFPLHPVITIVLNFSSTPWNSRNSLHNITAIPKKFKPQELAEMENEGRSVSMCNVAQALEEKGIEKGIQQEKINRIQRMIRKGFSKEDILEWDYTEEEYLEAKSRLYIM